MQPEATLSTQKRQREDSAEDSTEDSAAVEYGWSPWHKERQRLRKRWTPNTFYDSLTKVSLTRAELDEFDRRVRLAERDRESKSAKPPASTLPPRGSRGSTQLARRTRPDLTFLRGVSDSRTCRWAILGVLNRQQYASRVDHGRGTMSQSTPSGSKGASPLASPHDPNFEQKMIEGGVYPPRFRSSAGKRPPKPLNTQELRAMLRVPRPSLSPSCFREEDFEGFQDINGYASNKAVVMIDVLPVIAGQRDWRSRPAHNVL